MNHQLALAIAGSALLLLSGCSTKITSDSDAPTSPPTASVTLEASHAAYWASGGGGSGTLHFNGQDHAFKFAGVGVGGTGAEQISATGDVYNLHKLSDFAGTYNGIRTGITIFKGKLYSKLTNEHGVIVYIKGKTSGLASASGASTIDVQLK